MIYLSDVRDWLKSFEIAEHYYIGKLDNKPDKAFGVYSIKQSGAPVQAIGQEMSYRELAVSVLIHWNNNADSTDRAASPKYFLRLTPPLTSTSKMITWPLAQMRSTSLLSVP